jgi:hypothetical protein
MPAVEKSHVSGNALLLSGLVAATTPAYAADWEWTLVPYLWGPEISMDVSVRDEPVIGADLPFNDLLEKLDFALLAHFEGRRGRAGFFLDLTYLDVGESQSTVARPPLPGGTRVNTDMSTVLFELGGFYRLSGDTAGLDLLLGARAIDIDMTLDISLPPPLTATTQVSGSDTFIDAFAGLRYQTPLGERWSFIVRGDAGAGETDLAWNAQALVGYNVGKERHNVILFGYRHMEVEFKDSGSSADLEADLTMSGPIAGFAFRF